MDIRTVQRYLSHRTRFLIIIANGLFVCILLHNELNFSKICQDAAVVIDINFQFGYYSVSFTRLKLNSFARGGIFVPTLLTNP